MPNQLSLSLIQQLMASSSEDPFLMLFTLSHPSFANEVRLVNNTEDIVSNGNTFTAFPVSVTMPNDDGESQREVRITFDNVSRYLIRELRGVTTPIDIKIEMVLASDPDFVEISLEDLKLKQIQYNSTRVSGNIVMDNFLNTAMGDEKYVPTIYPGLF